MLGLCTDLLGLRLAGSPCQFLLNSAEGYRIDNGRMVVFHVVFRSLSVIDHDLFGEAVLDVGLVDDRISFVFLVGEDGLYRGVLPYALAGGCRDLQVIELLCNPSEAVACKESFVYLRYCCDNKKSEDRSCTSVMFVR